MSLNKDFEADVKAFFDGTEEALDEIMPIAAQLLEDDIQERCPVDTGYMKSTFESSIPPASVQPGDVLTITYDAHYAIFVHDGTSRQASQPWVDEAVANWPDHFDTAAIAAGWAA